MGIELLLEWEGRTFPVGLRAELQAAAFGRRPKAAAGGESGTPPESWGLLHWSEKVLLLPLLASSSRVDHFLHGLSKVLLTQPYFKYGELLYRRYRRTWLKNELLHSQYNRLHYCIRHTTGCNKIFVCVDHAFFTWP